MRIACPSCGAEYDVPDRLLAGPARRLRCSRCATDFALPVAPVAPPSPAPAPAPPPVPEVPAEPPAPAAEPVAPPAPAVPQRAPVAQAPQDRRLVGAWAASALVLLGGAAAMLAFRTELMAAWPPVTRVFMVLGLA